MPRDAMTKFLRSIERVAFCAVFFMEEFLFPLSRRLVRMPWIVVLASCCAILAALTALSPGPSATCVLCGREKPLREFPRAFECQWVPEGVCKDCVNEVVEDAVSKVSRTSRRTSDAN